VSGTAWYPSEQADPEGLGKRNKCCTGGGRHLFMSAQCRLSKYQILPGNKFCKGYGSDKLAG